MSSEAKKYFIPVNGELVEVSEELYREYYRPICDMMGRTPPWAKGLPLRADGYETEFYKKD